MFSVISNETCTYGVSCIGLRNQYRNYSYSVLNIYLGTISLKIRIPRIVSPVRMSGYIPKADKHLFNTSTQDVWYDSEYGYAFNDSSFIIKKGRQINNNPFTYWNQELRIVQKSPTKGSKLMRNEEKVWSN